jgi:hypothetical protein
MFDEDRFTFFGDLSVFRLRIFLDAEVNVMNP